MITEKDIKKAVEIKGWKIEENDISNIPEIDEKEIGFSTGSGVWYWFTVETIGGETFVNFRNRYSQNNGKTSRGYKTGCKAEEMIKSAIDPNYNRIYS